MIDSRFRWNSKETDSEKQRDNTDILGNEPYVSEFIKSWSARKKCTTVYMFPFAAFSEIKAIVKKPEKKDNPIAVTEKKGKASTEKSDEQKIDKLIDCLSELSKSIAGDLEMGWACNDDITDFQNKLMRLKCLDETNKMIPYFEQMSKDWPQQKKKQSKGLITSILDFLYR